MKKEKLGKEVIITGFVTPEQWDKDHNVIAIGIATDDEDYVVELNKLGEELFDYLDEDVEVTGIIRQDKDGTKHIKVTSYEVLDGGDHDEDDEYLTDDGYDGSDSDDED